MRTAHSLIFEIANGTPLLLRRELVEHLPALVGKSYADIRAEYGIAGGSNAPALDVVDGVAIIPITGPITRSDGWCSALFGGTSIDGLRAQLREALASPRVSSILFYVDSPGGSGDGLADMADEIRAACAVKPVEAFVDGIGASAAYWLAAAAETITVSQSGYVGSIGAYTVHTDTSKAEEARGIMRTKIIASQSPRKVPDPSTEAGYAQLQQHIDECCGMFIAAVARFRGVDDDTVQQEFGQGDIVIAADAVSRGMADAVGTLDAALGQVRARAASPSMFRADTASDLPEKEPSMSIWSKFKALFSADTDPGDEAVNAAFAEVIPPATAGVSESERSALAQLIAQQATLQQQALTREADAWAASVVQAKKALPTEQPSLAGMFAAAAKLDAAGGTLFGEDGALVVGAHLTELKSAVEGRPALTHLFTEQLPNGETKTVPGATRDDATELAAYRRHHGLN